MFLEITRRFLKKLEYLYESSFSFSSNALNYSLEYLVVFIKRSLTFWSISFFVTYFLSNFEIQ